MCCWICFSAIIHLQKAPITASLEMCLIYNLPLMGENIIIYSKKTFLMLIFEKSIYITFRFFGKYLGPRKELTEQDLGGQYNCKCN